MKDLILTILLGFPPVLAQPTFKEELQGLRIGAEHRQVIKIKALIRRLARDGKQRIQLKRADYLPAAIKVIASELTVSLDDDTWLTIRR